MVSLCSYMKLLPLPHLQTQTNKPNRHYHCYDFVKNTTYTLNEPPQNQSQAAAVWHNTVFVEERCVDDAMFEPEWMREDTTFNGTIEREQSE